MLSLNRHNIYAPFFSIDGFEPLRSKHPPNKHACKLLCFANTQQRKEKHTTKKTDTSKNTTDPRTYKYIYQVVIGWDMREG